jgi:hypothetical protein
MRGGHLVTFAIVGESILMIPRRNLISTRYPKNGFGSGGISTEGYSFTDFPTKAMQPFSLVQSAAYK